MAPVLSVVIKICNKEFLKKPEIMVKRRIWLFLILIAVLSLLLLSCHVHLHKQCGAEDSCPLCQILCAGLTYVPIFNFILLFILLISIFFIGIIKFRTKQYYDCRFRAPPVQNPANEYLN
ncbi:MAG TPA: hypothetical protein DDW65_11650 [Firmicutes bacterium]|nr:hypothetical protein [Bacillota bacterium]